MRPRVTQPCGDPDRSTAVLTLQEAPRQGLGSLSQALGSSPSCVIPAQTAQTSVAVQTSWESC